MLAIALMGRNFGVRPSKILNIDDEVMALDIDMLCNTRLFLYDHEQADQQMKNLAASFGTPTGAPNVPSIKPEKRQPEEW